MGARSNAGASRACALVAGRSLGSSVQVLDKASILLASEKPIYQPGQVIHVRALALGRAAHTASSNQPLTFELEDSRGNKVLKRRTQTDPFGIASATFQLTDEVNLGTYHLRAVLGDPDTGNTAELVTARRQQLKIDKR